MLLPPNHTWNRYANSGQISMLHCYITTIILSLFLCLHRFHKKQKRYNIYKF